MTRREDGAGGLTPSELQRRAITGSLWTAAHTVVSVPLAFGANVVVARSLGVADYGHLTFLTASLGLAVAVANLGFSSSVVQWGSAAEVAGNRSATNTLLGRSLGFHMTAELPILLIVVGALGHHAATWELIALAVGVSLPCLVSGGALSLTIEARTADAARIAIAGNLVLQVATAAAAASTRSAPAVWAVRTIVPAITILWTLIPLDRDRRASALRPKPPLGLERAFWRFALWSWLSSMLALLVFSRSEVFLLRVFHEPGALGLFALAFGLSQQITAPADAMLNSLIPAVTGLVTAWPERAQQALERSTRVSALVCGAIGASLVPPLVFAIPILYGHSFDGAAWLFAPLAAVSIIQTVNNPILAFTNARRRGGLIAGAYLAGLVVDVVVAIGLIPPFGAWGAVVANVCGQLTALVILTSAERLAIANARRFASLHLPLLLGFGGGAIASLAGLGLRSTSTGGALVVAGVAGAAIYVGAVRRLGIGLTQDDHAALMNAAGGRAGRLMGRALMPMIAPQPGP